MAFDVKQLMVDITKAGGPQQEFHFCFPTFCGHQTQYCWCTFVSCGIGTCGYWTCGFGTWGCGGTYCAGTETILFQQSIDAETLNAVKAQLHRALKEVEEHEKKLAEEAKKSGK